MADSQKKDAEKFKHLKLKLLPHEFKYVLFENSADFWKAVEDFRKSAIEPYFLFHTQDDHSLLVPSHSNVKGTKEEGEWKAFRIIGEMPFGTVSGLIATITEALRRSEIGVCVISTFLTDFFFVKQKNMEKATNTLKKIGWDFVE